MAIALQRLTTEYIDSEDRFRLSGDVADAAPVVMWMTQRLFLRIVPPLLAWVEANAGQPVQMPAVQSFVQQAARAELPRQTPVRPRQESPAWLIHAVDITQSPQTIRLTFRGPQRQEAAFTLAAKPMRQWLGIVQDVWMKSGWPMECWPAWMRESAQADPRGPGALH